MTGGTPWRNVVAGGYWERRYPGGKVGHVVARTCWDGTHDHVALYDGRVLHVVQLAEVARELVDTANLSAGAAKNLRTFGRLTR